MTKDILVIGEDNDIFYEIRNNVMYDETVEVYYTDSVEEGIWKLQIHNYCLIILDMVFSDGNGMEAIVKIRQMNPIPILVLSENSCIQDKVIALTSGADDFLVKPYDLAEFMARINALLRRYTELNHLSQRSYIVVGHEKLLLDTGRRILSVEGKETALTPKEFGILLHLLKNRCQTVTYEQIYETVWNDIYLGDKDTVFFHIGQLRRKMGAEWIESVYGVGYRLKRLEIA